MYSHNSRLSCANPSYTESELVHQITDTKTTFIITHPGCLAVARAAATRTHFPLDRIAIICPPLQPFHSESNQLQALSRVPSPVHSMGGFTTLEGLITIGLTKYNVEGKIFLERRLTKGEAKTKLAFLSFSSGTTGKPKVREIPPIFFTEVMLRTVFTQAVAIPHYAVTSNVIMAAAYLRINDPTLPWKDRRMRDGDVSIGILPMFRELRIISHQPYSTHLTDFRS